MNSYKIFSFVAMVFICSNLIFCQVNNDNFEFEYNDIKYKGSIELPNQKVRGLIVLVPGPALRIL